MLLSYIEGTLMSSRKALSLEKAEEKLRKETLCALSLEELSAVYGGGRPGRTRSGGKLD